MTHTLQKIPNFVTLNGQWLNKYIFHLQLNRPKQLNTFNKQLFQDLIDIFSFLNKCPDLRAIVLSANGNIFSAGLDLKEAPDMLFNYGAELDHSRKSIRLYDIIKQGQHSIMQLQNCRVPVLIGIHGLCLGAGLDFICTGDIRYCTQDTQFSIKEVDIGACADVGTMQRLPIITKNNSLFREIAYTGRYLSSEEAKQIGLVTQIFQDKSSMIESLIKLAEIISEKSPVAIWTIKQVLNHDLNLRLNDSLDYVARINSSMLFTDDMQESIRANLCKTKPIFPKL